MNIKFKSKFLIVIISLAFQLIYPLTANAGKPITATPSCKWDAVNLSTVYGDLQEVGVQIRLEPGKVPGGTYYVIANLRATSNTGAIWDSGASAFKDTNFIFDSKNSSSTLIYFLFSSNGLDLDAPVASIDVLNFSFFGKNNRLINMSSNFVCNRESW